MYFQNEIREVQGYGEKPKNLQIKPQEIKLAEQLESKQEGKPFTEPRAPRQAQVIDMMDALKKSLRETGRTGKRSRVAGEHALARNAKRLAS
jgi:non-homologous end joining protein Ku